MSLTSIIMSLQLAAALLTGLHGNTQVPTVIQQQAITLSSQVVQQAVQAEVMSSINFPTPKNNSIWPNITDLVNAAYIGQGISPEDGVYVPLGASVNLLEGDTSFGDINGDGLDDAAAIVQRTDSAGNTTVALAVMLNQNSSMFNIADVDLGGSNVQILSHHVVQGGDIVLNLQMGNDAPETSTYELLGEQLIKI